MHARLETADERLPMQVVGRVHGDQVQGLLQDGVVGEATGAELGHRCFRALLVAIADRNSSHSGCLL